MPGSTIVIELVCGVFAAQGKCHRKATASGAPRAFLSQLMTVSILEVTNEVGQSTFTVSDMSIGEWKIVRLTAGFKYQRNHWAGRLTPGGRVMRRRRSSGQALAEGAASLILIIGGTVLAVLLLVNSGMAAYYKIKLSVVSSKAADYASSLKSSNDPDWENKTKERVKWLMGAMGIKYDGNPVVTFSTSSEPSADPSAVILNVKANGLALVGDYFGVITMQDTSVGTPGAAFAGSAIVYLRKDYPPSKSPLFTSPNTTRYYVPLIGKDNAHPQVMGVWGPGSIQTLEYYDQQKIKLP